MEESGASYPVIFDLLGNIILVGRACLENVNTHYPEFKI